MPHPARHALALMLLATISPLAEAAEAWTGPRAALYMRMIESVYGEQPGIPLVQADALQANLGPGQPLVLDTRSREEFGVSHLEGARWVGYEVFDLASLEDVPKDTPIVVYCSIGYRSGVIAGRLQEAGFQDVQNLYGGLFLWFNESRPVYRGGDAVNEIHPYDWMWGRWIARGERLTVPPASKETP